jgi:hypothetical protein
VVPLGCRARSRRPPWDSYARLGKLGISFTTLERAKKKLGITSVKLDLNRWGWQLPGSDVTESKNTGA